MDVTDLARADLDELEALPTANIHAFRRGLFAATGPCHGTGKHTAFRRVGGKVRLELWDFHRKASDGMKREFALPPGLEARAARLLDR